MGRLGTEIERHVKEGSVGLMTKEIPDEVVNEFCAVGRYDQIASEIAKRFQGPIDVVSLPPDAPQELIRELRGE